MKQLNDFSQFEIDENIKVDMFTQISNNIAYVVLTRNGLTFTRRLQYSSESKLLEDLKRFNNQDIDIVME